MAIRVGILVLQRGVDKARNDGGTLTHHWGYILMM